MTLPSSSVISTVVPPRSNLPKIVSYCAPACTMSLVVSNVVASVSKRIPSNPTLFS